MAKSSFTRREFLQISAMTSSAMAMGACASLDQFFLGDKHDLTDEVIVLGAGAAGLAAAYHLKKRKIPYRVFEASSRIGGRVQSVSIFPEGGPVAELGAEYFDDTHDSVHAAAEDLNLPIHELSTHSGHESHLFVFNGQVHKVKDIAARLKTVEKPLRRIQKDLFRDVNASLTYRDRAYFDRSSYYDSMSLQDLLESFRREVDPLILKLIQVQSESRFGVDADIQSSLHFLSTLSVEGSALLAGRRTFRLEGGLSRMMSALHDRVAGVIPQYLVKTEHALVGISENKGVFEFIFKTPHGHQSYRTKNVICTIPFSKLRSVDGIQKLGLSDLKKEAIFQQSYATHSKGYLAYAEPFWQSKVGSTPANLGNFTGDFSCQKFWDSGRAQDGKQGLLTFQIAGKNGASGGEESIKAAIKDLEIFYPSIGRKDLIAKGIVNWSTKPWVEGSMAYFKKGQYMKFKGAAIEPEYGGNFLFAGEHTSVDFSGTLNGALETGIAAASSISRKVLV